MSFVSNEVLYGYNIFQFIEYKIQTRTLINIKNGRIKRFGETKARLFEYLLAGADAGVVHDEDIIKHVFYDYGLRCSSSYLLTMIKNIQFSFNSVGYDRYPFSRMDRKGYLIEGVALKRIYYYKAIS